MNPSENLNNLSNGFRYVGTLGASKSLVNRALITQSYFPQFKVIGQSQCDDVRLMREGLLAFEEGREIQCGHAGTVLRFLALRVSRRKGNYVLNGSERLFSRPQRELVTVLNQLGVDVEVQDRRMLIQSSGWHPMGDIINIPSNRSSQFSSAILLNSWKLPFPLPLSISSKNLVSSSYLDMTLTLMELWGMEIHRDKDEYYIPKNQSLKAPSYSVDLDMSSAFTLSALAATGGSLRLTPFPEQSLQGDYYFVEILRQMGISHSIKDHCLHVDFSNPIRGLQVNLEDTPDLFPVLAALCVFANGESLLFGAPQLVHKESNRLKKIQELLEGVGCSASLEEEGTQLRVQGQGNTSRKSQKAFVYDTDQDHRLVMAAALLKRGGFPIEIQGASSVSKSFPEFLKIM